MRSACAALACLVALTLAPGCSLARDAIPTPSGALDVGVARDGGELRIDVGVTPNDGGGARLDAAVPRVDGGGCHGDADCPADDLTLGACVYANTCATTGTMDEMRTHHACIAGTCTPQMSTASSSCSRETDGTVCGAAPSCGPCSATDCGGTGMQMCAGPMCQGGVCAPTMTTVSCTTPDDMCGGVPGWGVCYYDILAGHCQQTRTWGRCVLGTCAARVGNTETRACSC